MNREIFSHFVTNPETITSPDLPSLEAIAEQFPYCQLAHFFVAKPHYDLLTVHAEQKVQRAAIHAISRYKLKKFLEIPARYKAAENSVTEEHPVILPESVATLPQVANMDVQPSPVDELLIREDFSDLSLEKDTNRTNTPEQAAADQAPNNSEENLNLFNDRIKKLKQLEIIDNFIKTEPRISSLSTLSKDAPSKDLSENSIKAPEGLVSENLANIMIKQGKTNKAIEIYEKLIVKFPEKKLYFAEIIENLKNK